MTTTAKSARKARKRPAKGTIPTVAADFEASAAAGKPIVTELPHGWSRTVYTVDRDSEFGAIVVAAQPPVRADRLPILSLAASMGGLLPLRRAVDELIAGLAPELREGAKP
jgi:hypothetical protein